MLIGNFLHVKKAHTICLLVNWGKDYHNKKFKWGQSQWGPKCVILNKCQSGQCEWNLRQYFFANLNFFFYFKNICIPLLSVKKDVICHQLDVFMVYKHMHTLLFEFAIDEPFTFRNLSIINLF